MKMSIKKTFLLSAVIILTIFHVQAQETDFDIFLRAGAEDGSKLIKSYLEPVVLGFSYGMANSWYNTAKTHETLGFDLTISGNLTNVPGTAEYFTFDATEYQYVTSTGETNQIPTIMGPAESNGAELTFSYYDETTGKTIEGSYRPTGLGFKEQFGYNVVPSPMIQLGVGTFINTDIIIRYTPQIKYGDFKTSVFGLGIKHDLMQWFVKDDKKRPVDIAILGAFSGFDNVYDMSQVGLTGQNQETLFNINNWTVQGIVSKKISVLTLYGSFGYSGISSELSIKGTYIVEDENDPTTTFTVTDPVSVNYKENSFRGTGGLMLKLSVITLHADYTWQKYSIVSAGIGISVK